MPSLSSVTTAVGLCLAAGLGTHALIRLYTSRSKLRQNHPPIIDIPMSEIFNSPREAYEKALREHGPVIAVRRKGNLEYIVDETLIPTLFTTNHVFSFEEAMATILNLRPFVSFFWEFFHEIDDLVQNGVNSMLGMILERMCPVFIESAEHATKEQKVDMFEYAHTSIAKAMMVVIFGEIRDERSVEVITAVATDMANLTGMYQNSAFLGRHLPTIYIAWTWIRVVSTTILAYFRIIGPQVWTQLRSRRWINSEDERLTTVLEYMAYKHADKAGRVGFGSFVWIMSMLLGLIFASVHQTASVSVWIIFELALRPKYISLIREEALEHVDPITRELSASNIAERVQNAPWLDAFIREVMRTKGDTLSTCRQTTADTDLGGRTIPKGKLVFPLATLAHMNPAYHPDPDSFKPERWHGPNHRPAVMGSASYIAFGMGRWACPGRVLAVSEIKMIVWTLVLKATPRLVGNKYQIVDPLNITSVPPEGDLIFENFLA
ncbi:hypothetical protein HMN09_00879700 [Mycena chlorophos]|uniref:Cytochrome P450 n=1 Tax=Mycena chlorophos TaxID=658473 RepID=A0A8H6SPN6_MYCCL|nr:hypothetical protein HMN09_00879700 [Mycena chlorophos]